MDLSPSQLDGFAREVAGQVSEGYSFEQVASSLDLAVHELEEIFESTQFKDYLDSYGDAVTEAFKETRAASRAGSFHRKISERFDTYYEELDKLAMDPKLKPEKRADILLTLMKYVAPQDQEAHQVVRMPPALITNWVKRNQEYEAAEKAGLIPGSASRIGDTSGRETKSEEKPVLLRKYRDADDGSDSGAAPAVRELHSDEPVERGAGEQPEKTGVDAERALQIIHSERGVSTLVTDPRQEYIDSANFVERSEHEEVAGRDKEDH